METFSHPPNWQRPIRQLSVDSDFDFSRRPLSPLTFPDDSINMENLALEDNLFSTTTSGDALFSPIQFGVNNENDFPMPSLTRCDSFESLGQRRSTVFRFPVGGHVVYPTSPKNKRFALDNMDTDLDESSSNSDHTDSSQDEMEQDTGFSGHIGFIQPKLQPQPNPKAQQPKLMMHAPKRTHSKPLSVSLDNVKTKKRKHTPKRRNCVGGPLNPHCTATSVNNNTRSLCEPCTKLFVNTTPTKHRSRDVYIPSSSALLCKGSVVIPYKGRHRFKHYKLDFTPGLPAELSQVRGLILIGDPKIRAALQNYLDTGDFDSNFDEFRDLFDAIKKVSLPKSVQRWLPQDGIALHYERGSRAAFKPHVRIGHSEAKAPNCRCPICQASPGSADVRRKRRFVH